MRKAGNLFHHLLNAFLLLGFKDLQLFGIMIQLATETMPNLHHLDALTRMFVLLIPYTTDTSS